MEKGSVGVVSPRTVTLEGPLELESGGTLPRVTVAYETYGALSPAKDNAVLVCHALSGDAHAAGYHPDPKAPPAPSPDAPPGGGAGKYNGFSAPSGAEKPGWWDSLIGPGKALDTDRYFVVCQNFLGSCYGTTGPTSENPSTGQPYRLDFPFVTVRDMVEVQARLLDHLGIPRLLA